MYEAQAIIERIRRVSATVQRLDVAVEKPHRDIGPGQLLLARITESLDPYLREPWVAVDKQAGNLVIERPANRGYSPGQVVSLLGPVGKPIPCRDSIRALLLVAYDSSPAILLMLAANVLARGGAVTLALIGRAAHYPLEVLPPEVEVVRAPDHERWTDRNRLITWAEQIVAVAPPPFDMVHYARLADEVHVVRLEPASDYLFGVFGPAMPCGVGACQACLIPVRGEESPACLDGPAYDLFTVSLGGK